MTQRGDWDPLGELRNVQKRLNMLFENALARSNFETPEGFDSWSPQCDCYETPGALVICLELPGLEQDAIDLRVDGDELIVEGERKMERGQPGERYHRVERSFGRFRRAFRVPSTVDREAVHATYRDGLLRVELPRKGVEQPGTIRVDID
jgi:HSP20 family protein